MSNVVCVVPMEDSRKTGYKFLAAIPGGKHLGQDLNSGNSANADLGLRIGAWAAGKVIYAGFAGNSNGGNVIILEHPQFNRWSRYMHLKQIDVKIGDSVFMNQKIGECGKTGTNSPHLHWEIWQKLLEPLTSYPKSWSLAKIKEYFCSPYDETERLNKQFAQEFPEWASDSVEAAKIKGLPSGNLSEEMTVSGIQKDLLHLKQINAIGSLPRYRWYTILKKFGFLKT